MRITPSLSCFYSLFGVMSFVNKGHSQLFDWSVQLDKNCGEANECPMEPDNGCGANQVVVGTAGTAWCSGIIDTTIDDCKAACEQKPECAGFNWHNHRARPGLSCFLRLSTTCGVEDRPQWDCYELARIPTPAPTRAAPSASPSVSSAPSAAPSASPSVSSAPSAAPSASPSVSSAPSASPSSSPSVSSAPSASPSSSPSVSTAPSAAPSASPSISSAPSAAPSASPSISSAPSAAPSSAPSVSSEPSASPSAFPSVSSAPSASPSESPSVSLAPSAAPSASPSVSSEPSSAPSASPSISSAPSASPSASPSVSLEPSVAPSASPSVSSAPSSAPSASPSASVAPSASPSASPSVQSASANGDPHFVTWGGRKFDFHGVCDLVLLQNPGFQQGLGLDIHLRTKQLKQFSYISSAVLRIGDETLEVMGSVHENLYWINKQQSENTNNNEGIVGEINGNDIEYRQVNSKQHEFVVDLGGASTITMRTYKNFVYVGINGATKPVFGSSRGLVGAYDTALLESRDGSKVFADIDEFGQEWQVQPGDGALFHSVEGPQAPDECGIPLASNIRRRLQESAMSDEEAELSCARVDPDVFDMCVFDVMATGDIDVAGAY